MEGLIIISLAGNSIALHSLKLGKGGFNITIFLNIILADVLVTLFLMAGRTSVEIVWYFMFTMFYRPANL